MQSAGLENPPEAVKQFFYDQATIDVAAGAGDENPSVRDDLIAKLEAED